MSYNNNDIYFDSTDDMSAKHCNNCKKEYDNANHYHKCPYSDEILNEIVLCNCCDDCNQLCNDEI